ncbi:MAG: hypothetical protein AB8G22_07990 [Saprospiraceae bacterium]
MMRHLFFSISVLLFLASCGNDPLDTEFNFGESEYVYEQISGTFYQIEATLEASVPNFDFVGTELTTERVDIEHCKIFTRIEADTVELWSRSFYDGVVDQIREGRIYCVEYDKMINSTGFDKVLGVFGDEFNQSEISVPKAFNEAGQAYNLVRTNSGRLVLTVGPVSKTIGLSTPIKSEYMVKEAGTNNQVEITETHHIVHVIKDPIIKYPKEQRYCF